MNEDRRTLFMRALRDKWELVQGGRYFVKRGPIHWPTFDFKSNPYAAAIMLDVYRPFDREATAQVSFEVATPIPPGNVPQLDDGVLQALLTDVEWVVREVIEHRENGDSVVLHLDTKNLRSDEFHDPALMVQGVVINFSARL